ncbi:hypothetical protein Tco_0492462 [Tanacetum coccineum]
MEKTSGSNTPRILIPLRPILGVIQEGSSPPLLLRQFSVKWWKQIEESQANKEAVIKYHSSLIQESPGISTKKIPMANMDIAKKIKECENKQELERLINEIRSSPTPCEDLFHDS